MEAVMDGIQIERYSAYKDSGVEWLAEIPKHWECIRMKHLFSDVSIKNKPNAELLSVTQDQGVVPRTWVENRMVMPSGALESFKHINKGDFAISLRSFEGGLEYCHHDGIISPAYTVLKAKRKFDAQYYKYLFKSDSFISELQTSVVGIRQGKNISYEELCYSLLPIPESKEQTAIAAFLDRKTGQVDKAITIKEKQIELLKERRQILIQKAVTRGLNPDVKMKDSGVEWIGEIPEGWEVKKLKFLFTLKGGGTPSKERKDFWDGDIPWVSPKDMKSEYITSTEDYVTHKGVKNSSTNYIEANTLLMVVRSGILQRTIPVAISSVGLTINQDLKAFTPTNEMSTKYFYYFIKGNDPFLISEWVKEGATVESVEAELLKNGLVTVPSLKEQDSIVNYIEHFARKISAAIQGKEVEIDKLKEYKYSLINSAVTGKLKVK